MGFQTDVYKQVPVHSVLFCASVFLHRLCHLPGNLLFTYEPPPLTLRTPIETPTLRAFGKSSSFPHSVTHLSKILITSS